MADFKSPPIELPFEHVFDFHAIENPDHIAITHPCIGGQGFTAYTYSELVPGIHRAGESLISNLNLVRSASPSLRVVAIILTTGKYPII